MCSRRANRSAPLCAGRVSCSQSRGRLRSQASNKVLIMSPPLAGRHFNTFQVSLAAAPNKQLAPSSMALLWPPGAQDEGLERPKAE